MGDARIGRLLIASLHQAITDVLPTRLEFYEHWLSSAGLRGGLGGPALGAVVSFLRREGARYDEVMARAGEYATDWTFAALPGARRAVLLALPGLTLRTRGALWVVRRLVHESYPGSRASVRLRRLEGTVDIHGSLFCGVRDVSAAALCGFYASAVRRLLECCSLSAATRIAQCRATGSDACRLAVVVRRTRADRPVTPAAA